MNKSSLIKRLILLARRKMVAAKMGVHFPGTTNFKMPESFQLNGKRLSIAAPNERGLVYDFLNLVLDDEYGLRKISEPPSTILDVGANIGLFSLAAGALFPRAKIHAYEPNPRIQRFLERNVKQIGAEVFAEAVGAAAGTGEMRDSGDSRSSLFIKGGEIPITPIAEAISRLGGKIDLLKLDCEGAEWEILKLAEVMTNVRSIRMEYHLFSGERLEDLLDLVKLAGFRVRKLQKNQNLGLLWLERQSV